MTDARSRTRGCLLGGAVGDALGAPVEFLTLEEIRARYGPHGIVAFDTAYGRVGAITDDTQMTLFTAEGLLRATTRAQNRGICHVQSVVRHAYQRWLFTQGWTAPGFTPPGDGWLITLRALHAKRAPGRTCVTALQGDRLGSREEPLNTSKGCGAVMRGAPVGLILPPASAFEMGADIGALTHGHPSGYWSAGALATMVGWLLRGESLPDAVARAGARLREAPDGRECLAALDAAVALAGEGSPSAEQVDRLGGGWVGESALAIAVYAALSVPDDFAAGVRLAVNHSGDSDSTGAIAGNLLGAALGEDAIPAEYLAALELREEITALADDIVTGFRADQAWIERYPGW